MMMRNRSVVCLALLVIAANLWLLPPAAFGDDSLNAGDAILGDLVLRRDEGRVVGVGQADGLHLDIQRDEKGRLLRVRGPGGAQVDYSRPRPGRLELRGPGEARVVLDQTPDGRLLRVEDPLGNVTRFGYDQSGRRQQVSSPTSGETRYRRARREAGGLDVMMDGSAGRVAMELDASGRLLALTTEQGGREELERDARGRVVHLRSRHCDILRQYDDLGRLTRSQDRMAGVVLRWSYDDAGRRVSLDGPFGSIRWLWTEDGCFAGVEGLGARVGVDVDSRGRLEAMQLGTALVQKIRYDGLGNITEIETTRQGQDEPLETVRYRHDELGNRVVREDHRGTTEIRRDAGLRVAEVDAPEGDYRFIHDAFGNRIWQRQPGREPSGVEIAAGCRLAGSGVEVDAAGRVVALLGDRGSRKLEWDELGRLVAVVGPGDQRVRYGYSPEGQLIWRQEGDGARVHYIYDGDQLVCAVDAEGQVLAAWLHGPATDQPYAVRRGEEMHYLLRDGGLNITGWADAEAEVRQRFAYSPYGSLLDDQGHAGLRYGFAGRPLDGASGFIYMRARWYDPETGRFLSPDPMGISHGNPYAYAGGNPYDYADPPGTFAVSTALLLAMGTTTAVNTLVALVEELIRHDGKLAEINKGRLLAAAGAGAAWGAAGFFLPHTLLGYMGRGLVLGGSDRFLRNAWNRYVLGMDTSLGAGVAREAAIGGTVFAATSRIGSIYSALIPSSATSSATNTATRSAVRILDAAGRPVASAAGPVVDNALRRSANRALAERFGLSNFARGGTMSSIFHASSNAITGDPVVVDLVLAPSPQFREITTSFDSRQSVNLRLLVAARGQAARVEALVRVASSRHDAVPLREKKFGPLNLAEDGVHAFQWSLGVLPEGRYWVYAQMEDRAEGGLVVPGWKWQFTVRPRVPGFVDTLEDGQPSDD